MCVDVLLYLSVLYNVRRVYVFESVIMCVAVCMCLRVL